MREGDQIELLPVKTRTECAADDFVHPWAWDKALDGQPADRDDEIWFEQEDFLSQPLGAIFNLGGIRDPVAAGGGASRETTADGRHVNMGAEHFFAHAGRLLEPTEEPLASRPGEGTPENGLAHARRLSHQQNAAEDRSAGHGGRVHLWTKPAGKKLGDMRLEETLPNGVGAFHEPGAPRITPGTTGLPMRKCRTGMRRFPSIWTSRKSTDPEPQPTRSPRDPACNTCPTGPDRRGFRAASKTFNFRATPSRSDRRVNAPGQGFMALMCRQISWQDRSHRISPSSLPSFFA
jgi:hypothetical protein